MPLALPRLLAEGIITLSPAEQDYAEAIALAQGTNPDAALDHAKLIRRGPDGPEETPLALKKMLALKTPDIKLEAEDIIFVPVSGARAFSHRGLEAIVQAATGVAMYSHY